MKVSKDWYKNLFDSNLVDTIYNNKEVFEVARSDVNSLIELLNLKKDHKILDVPCGAGRHSIHLAKLGYSVSGVDISRDCISLAQRKIRNYFQNRINFAQGDMLNLKKYYNQYDILLNLWTSIGYMPTDKQNSQVIKNLISCLKPGGKICFGKILIRDYLKKHFVPNSWSEQKTHFMLQQSDLDETTNYISTSWIIIPKNGKKRKEYKFRHKLYSKSEIVSLMKQHGLKNIKVYGSIKGAKFNASKSAHPVFVGTKI